MKVRAMSKLIPLHSRNGDVIANAIVDDDDFEWINQWTWFALTRNDGRLVAGTQSKRKNLRMHRLICDASPGEHIDHKNQDTLDNRRCNLRKCTRSQNEMNKSKPKGCKSPYKGVSISSDGIYARIGIDGKRIYLGRFSTELDAARAYDHAARLHFGEFARLNFPESE
jgi:hypothetical protein